MIPELIRLESRGRSTDIYIAGLKLSRGIYGVKFEHSEDEIEDPKITMTFDLKETLRVLSEIPPEELEAAKNIVMAYLDGYKKLPPKTETV